MKTYFGSENLDGEYPAQAVIAVGNFDGVHLGHQELLRRARTLAKARGVPMVCYTFAPHPTLELRPQTTLRLLMTYAEKRETLSFHAVDVCVEEIFNAEFAALSAHDFFYEILKTRLHAVGVVVGHDFAFGRKREGNLEKLRQFCEETSTEAIVVPPVLFNSSPISSSRIRNFLAAGQIEEANELLGRPFAYRGEVVHGDKRGRLLGFPTANMKCEEKFPLRPGVYATSTVWHDIEYPSVTNIGTRPTFDSTELKIETHILDQDFDLYGQMLELRFRAPIRSEKKFSSVDELKVQIKADTELARVLLQRRP